MAERSAVQILLHPSFGKTLNPHLIHEWMMAGCRGYWMGFYQSATYMAAEATHEVPTCSMNLFLTNSPKDAKQGV